MTAHEVRRLPVIDSGTLVGTLTPGDLARALPDRQVGELVDALSAS
jgi:CBS domain-containing protein